MTPTDQISEVIAALRVLQRTMGTASTAQSLHRVDVAAHIGAPRIEMLVVLAHDGEHAQRLAALYMPEGIRNRARVMYRGPMPAGVVSLGWFDRHNDPNPPTANPPRTAASILEDVS